MKFNLYSWSRKILKIFFYIVITVLILPIYLPLLLICIAIRKCIDLALRKKIGHKYGGLLNGGDAFWTNEEEISRSITNVLFMIDSHPAENNFYATFKDFIQTRIFDEPKLAKFTGVFKKAWGYSYLLKNEYCVDECVTELLDDVRDERDLQEILSKYINRPLPKNHTAFWEILVGNNPIKWRQGNYCYPVLYRFHHSFCDGVNLLNVFATILNDKAVNVKPREERRNFFSKLKQILFDLLILLWLPAYGLVEILLEEKDSHSLHGKTLLGKKLCAWKIEDPYTIAKIKKIKSKIPHTTFTDVVITAISASYEEYFSKVGCDVPGNFTVGCVINPNVSDVLGNISGKFRPPVLSNDFSGTMLSIPIRWDSKSLVEKLKEISRRQTILKENNSIDANYWLMNRFPNYLPEKVFEFIKRRFFFSMSVSNIPGIPSLSMCGGHLVEDMVGWGLHYNKMGMSILLLTYGGERMQLGLCVDKALIDSVADLDGILEGISENKSSFDYQDAMFNGPQKLVRFVLLGQCLKRIDAMVPAYLLVANKSIFGTIYYIFQNLSNFFQLSRSCFTFT